MKDPNPIWLKTVMLVISVLGMISFIAFIAYNIYIGFTVDETLARAAGVGDEVEVKRLLNKGADPEATFDSQTAMQLAQKNNYPKIVEILKKAGAKR